MENIDFTIDYSPQIIRRIYELASTTITKLQWHDTSQENYIPTMMKIFNSPDNEESIIEFLTDNSDDLYQIDKTFTDFLFQVIYYRIAIKNFMREYELQINFYDWRNEILSLQNDFVYQLPNAIILKDNFLDFIDAPALPRNTSDDAFMSKELNAFYSSICTRKAYEKYMNTSLLAKEASLQPTIDTRTKHNICETAARLAESYAEQDAYFNYPNEKSRHFSFYLNGLAHNAFHRQKLHHQILFDENELYLSAYKFADKMFLKFKIKMTSRTKQAYREIVNLMD